MKILEEILNIEANDSEWESRRIVAKQADAIHEAGTFIPHDDEPFNPGKTGEFIEENDYWSGTFALGSCKIVKFGGGKIWMRLFYRDIDMKCPWPNHSQGLLLLKLLGIGEKDG